MVTKLWWIKKCFEFNFEPLDLRCSDESVNKDSEDSEQGGPLAPVKLSPGAKVGTICLVDRQYSIANPPIQSQGPIVL